MAKMSIADVNVCGKKCLVRVDYNVPLDENCAITSDNRITATLPTINYLLEQGASVILMSHLGRPRGKVVPSMSLAPVAKRLSVLLGRPVLMANDSVGESAKALVEAIKPGEVVMLENLRFYPQEEDNDQEFCQALASFCDIYVNDAFGTAHRAHASTAGIASYCKTSVCGFLIEKELSIMGRALQDPSRPFVAILGGSKVSDKIGVIKNLLTKVDCLLIGGAMTYTFYKALGCNVGNSRCESDKTDLAMQLIDLSVANNVKMLLPIDNICATSIDSTDTVISEQSIPEGLMGLDIGPKTIQLFCEQIKNAKTIIWNGPLGVFEQPQFANGTFAVAKAVAEADAVSIIGGGDSASAVKKAGYAKQVTHISTGGGASLEYLEGLALPGIECLDEK